MKRLRKFGDRIWSYGAYLAGAIMFAVSVLVIVNVLLRRLTNYSVLGCTEIVRYFMCIAAAFALMQNEWVDGNVRVTIVLESLSKRANQMVDFVCYAVTSVGFILITFFMCRQAIDTYVKGTLTNDLFMPMWIFSGILALGFVLLTICFWMRTVIKGYDLLYPAEKEVSE